MEKNVSVVFKEFEKVKGSLEHLVGVFNVLQEVTSISELTADELSLYFSMQNVANQLENSIRLIENANKDVLVEGYLKKKQNERFDLDGIELSSGITIEIWLDDEKLIDGGYYYLTRLELIDGDYRLYDNPYMKLDGKKARLKG
ncbi:DUF5348 domain-containing protein [Viridibacillus sp. NPDC093762]|uniref:DUF5348 domain-containing protein n=1 Tax=Viridibacillus sp. NPDC093762 TaxID=3390720 RepID=UPI003D0134CC